MGGGDGPGPGGRVKVVERWRRLSLVAESRRWCLNYRCEILDRRGRNCRTPGWGRRHPATNCPQLADLYPHRHPTKFSARPLPPHRPPHRYLVRAPLRRARSSLAVSATDPLPVDLDASAWRTTDGRGVTFAEVSSAMADFVATNGWDRSDSTRPQTPRNLAMSLAIELGELLECFQWSESAPIDRVEDELADVMLYAIQLANVVGVDIETAVLGKLERNRHRTWDRERARAEQ